MNKLLVFLICFFLAGCVDDSHFSERDDFGDDELPSSREFSHAEYDERSCVCINSNCKCSTRKYNSNNDDLYNEEPPEHNKINLIQKRKKRFNLNERLPEGEIVPAIQPQLLK